jgi:hypothetical protein
MAWPREEITVRLIPWQGRAPIPRDVKLAIVTGILLARHGGDGSRPASPRQQSHDIVVAHGCVDPDGAVHHGPGPGTLGLGRSPTVPLHPVRHVSDVPRLLDQLLHLTTDHAGPSNGWRPPMTG